MSFVISDHMPKESWWTKPDFYAAAKAEQERMRLSRYGQSEHIVTGVTIQKQPRVIAPKAEETV